MRIFKIGGSLTDTVLLKTCLDTITKCYPGTAVIVPGGGQFADQVRISQKQWQFNDQVAHQMAILAMQQMALLFQSVNQSLVIASSRKAIKQHLQEKKVVIWSPDMDDLNSSAVPASWDITSDTLSAWLAGKLSAQYLILVKSALLADENNVAELLTKGIVDPAFAEFTKNADYKIKFINRDQLQQLKTL